MRDSCWRITLGFVLYMAVGLLSLWPATPIAAQTTRADSAAILLDAATRLERSGRTAAAQDLYAMILARFGGTPAAEQAERLGSRITGEVSTRGRRVELQVWSTLYGLWLGVAVPAAFGADEPEAYGIGLLIGGPAGFLTGLGLARSREFSDGQTRAITYGGTWGTWQGFGWAEVFDWGEAEHCESGFCSSDGGTEERFAGMILGGLAGLGVGIALSGRTITNGVATSASLGSLWGSWFGFSIAFLADLRDDDLLAATLLAGNAGIVGSAIVASSANLSRNRARLISIAGVIGGLAGGGIDLIAQPDNENVVLAIPLIGSIAGLTIGALTTRNYDRTASPGGNDFDAALLRLDGGDWDLGAPIPSLVKASAHAGGRRSARPALGFTLFRARF